MADALPPSAVPLRRQGLGNRCAVGMLIIACEMLLASPTIAQDVPQRLPPPELSAEPLPAPQSLQHTALDAPDELLLLPPGQLSMPDGVQVAPDGAIIVPDGVQLPGPMIEPMLPDEQLWLEPQKISSHKNGFFQKLSLSGAWLGGGSDPGDLAITEIESFVTVAVPMPIREWPMLISPSYNMRLLDAPGGTDLPPRLHDAFVDFMWLPTFVHRWTMLLSVAPSVYSDFETDDADAFRVTGKGLVIYDWAPDRLQLIAGVLYLNRDDVRLLPAGGAIWTPTDYTRFELIFPKPKIGMRFNVGQGYEDWFYGLAEFGGNTWAIERVGGVNDKVTLFDYRVMLGVERKMNGGAGYRMEAGYVFGREVEYTSGIGNFNPPSTFIVRGGVTF